MNQYHGWLDTFLSNPIHVVYANLAALLVYFLIAHRKQVRFILKSLARNKLRSILTGVATFVLVLVVTLVWTILWFLDLVTSEKSKDFKAIVTERWQLPSQMPYTYAATLSEGSASKPRDIRPDDHMTWQFYGGTLDPAKRTRENIVFFFGMEPIKFLTMMDGISEISPTERAELERGIKLMNEDKRKVLLGKERLKAINKQVGETFKLTSLNYKDIDLEFEIAGTLPEGRYGQSAVMHRDYLNDALDAYNARQAKIGGPKHPMTDRSLNLVWLRVPDSEAFRQVSEQIMTSSLYSNPAVKCETASSGVAAFLDAYRDLLWGMRWLLIPAVLVTMSLVIANAISISVRERQTEMAVLKVLGYSPGQIMVLVLGEALVIGCGAGLLSSGTTWFVVNHVIGGVKFPIAFFPAFKIPIDALWWGPTIGGVTALVGSIVPAWSARSVKVSEVFSKIS